MSDDFNLSQFVEVDRFAIGEATMSLPPRPAVSAKPTLDFKQEKYVAELLATDSTERAKEAAGYMGNGCKASPYMKAKLVDRIAELKKTQRISTERVLQEYARVAFADLRCLVDDNGHPIPLQDLDDDTAAALAGVELEVMGDADGPLKTTRHKYKVADKLKALEILAKRLKLFEDTTNLNLSGEVKVEMSLNEKLRRTAFFLEQMVRNKEAEQVEHQEQSEADQS